MAGHGPPTRPPRPKNDQVAHRSEQYPDLIRVSHRDSMESEYAAHYHLVTDLSVSQVERRLRGNFWDRWKYNRSVRKYQKWARLSTQIHRELKGAEAKPALRNDMPDPGNH